MRQAIIFLAFLFAIVQMCLFTQHLLQRDSRSTAVNGRSQLHLKPKPTTTITVHHNDVELSWTRVAECDFLEREETLEEEEAKGTIADETALDPKTAKGPFIFLQVNSGTFNQFHGMWPVFLLAQELGATVLIGCGVSRNSFLDEAPRFHPVPQSLFWDIRYMHRYWKKRGVEVYFSNFEPLLKEKKGVVVTRPLEARPYSLMPPFNLIHEDAQGKWVGDELSSIVVTDDRQRQSQQFLQLKELQFRQLDQLRRREEGEETEIRLISQMNVGEIIEREINGTISSDTILYMPSDFTFGAFGTLTKETQEMAREPYLSIHMSPKILEMGCELWDAIRDQAGRSMIVGVHLRLENDAYVWWEDSKLSDRLAAYGNTILAITGRPNFFGYLAYGELPSETEKSIVEWADNLFGVLRWTTKRRTLNRLKNRGKKQGSRRSAEEKKEKKKKSYLDSNKSRRGYIDDILVVDQIEENDFVVEEEPDVAALVDAYILTECHLFLGPSVSSFSFTVEQWRSHLKRRSFYLHNAQPEPPFFRAW